jgi:hypothetical protein
MRPMSASPRIALIHATPLAMEPIQAAFQRHWPQVRHMNLLDDSLSHDRAQAGRLTEDLVRRFEQLARYAQGAGASGILFTCSAFGPAIEAAARATGLPTLKPNEAMFEQALALARGDRPLQLGLVATFQASLPSMTEELQEMARRRGAHTELRTVFVPEAMDDLAQGRPGDHHLQDRHRGPPAGPLRRGPAGPVLDGGGASHRAGGTALPRLQQPRLRRARAHAEDVECLTPGSPPPRCAASSTPPWSAWACRPRTPSPWRSS